MIVGSGSAGECDCSNPLSPLQDVECAVNRNNVVTTPA